MKSSRNRKKPEAVKPEPQLSEAEQALAAKYPHLVLVPGSLRAMPEKGPHKTGVEIRCGCGTTRAVALSDLFQVKACVGCTAEARKAARREKAAAKK